MNTNFADRALLTIILLAIFVVPSSISGIAVALPTIGLDLHARLTGLQWIVNAYNLAFACFILPWGALADRLGRKRCFIIGAMLYLAASLLSALAGNSLALDGARGLAGVGAAAIFSCGSAILSTSFEGPTRLRAFALFGTVAGLGVSLGPTLSGLLLDSVGWRAIFWAQSLTLGLVLLGSRSIPQDSKLTKATSRFDTLGASIFVLALLALMTAIAQGSQWGWLSLGVLSLAAVFTALLALFVWQEYRHVLPMLDLSLLGNGPFVGMALVTVAVSFGFVTLLTYLPSYLTGVQRLTAIQTGITMLLLTAPMLVGPMLASKLVTRGVAASSVLNTSLLCLLFGLMALAYASHPDMPLWQLAVPLLLIGSGMGLSAGLVDGLALKTVPPQKSGMAAGLLNTFRLGSEAIAVALYGSLLATLLEGQFRITLAGFAQVGTLQRWINDVAAGNMGTPLVGLAPDPASNLQHLLITGYNGAFHHVLWILAAIVLVLAGLIAWLIRPVETKAQTTTATS